MGGYVLRGNKNNKQHVTKRMPLEDKTNVAPTTTIKNIDGSEKKKMSRERRSNDNKSKCALLISPRIPESTKVSRRNKNPKNTNTDKTKNNPENTEKESKEDQNKQKDVISSVHTRQAKTHKNTEKESLSNRTTEDEFYYKVINNINQKQQINLNAEIVQKTLLYFLQENLLKLEKPLQCIISWKSCDRIESAIKSYFIQCGRGLRVILEKDKIIENTIIQSDTYRQYKSVPDLKAKELCQKELKLQYTSCKSCHVILNRNKQIESLIKSFIQCGRGTYAVLEKDKIIENIIIQSDTCRQYKPVSDLKAKDLYQKELKLQYTCCKSCHVILSRNKQIESLIKSSFIQCGRGMYSALEKNKIIMDIISQSQTYRQYKPVSDLKARKLHQKKLKFAIGDSDTRENTDDRRVLRKRNSRQNYAEKSLNEIETSERSENGTNERQKQEHVPIYRRTPLVKDLNKKKDLDVYELDLSVDENSKNRRKRKRCRSSQNSSLPFERYMKVIVNKLEQKYEKRSGKVQPNSAKVNQERGKKNIRQKVPDKNVHRKQQRQIYKEKAKILPVSICNLPPSKKKDLEMNLHVKGIFNKHENSTSTPKINVISHIVLPSKPSNIDETIKNTKATTSDDHGTSQIDSTIIDDISDDDDNVDEYNIPDQYISNVPNLREKSLNFTSMSPIANSTMVNNNFQEASTPWRLNLEVQRSPHFLQYKSSLLPNYNQDMVLKRNATEKSLKDYPTASKTVEPVRVQTSILKYVSGGKNLETLDTVNIESSLFDVHEFSPSKKFSPEKRSMEDKENAMKNTRKKVERVKRNILGLMVDNEQNIKSLQKDGEENVLRPTEISSGSDFFGFDNSKLITDVNDPSSTENSTNSDFFGFDNSKLITDVKDLSSKPFRINTVFPAVIRFQKDVAPLVEETAKKNKQEIVVEPVNLQEIGLFEDYQPERNLDYSVIKQYKRRRPRRRRSLTPEGYFTSESEDEQCHKVKRVKRKKEVRTKQEEIEAERWAANFNKMCEEIEKFPLEIE